MWDKLSRSIPGLVRVSPVEGCLPNTLMVAVPDRIGAEVLAEVAGVSASTGSACHAGIHSPSSALLAMGIDHDTALGALRLSTGRSTSEQDINHAAAAIAAVVSGSARASTAR